jgi:hypothetical protein
VNTELDRDTGQNVETGHRVNWKFQPCRRAGSGLGSGDRVDDLNRSDNGSGVVRKIDVESGVPLFIRVTRSRIFNYCDLVAQFSGVAYGRLDTRVSDESDHDELMNAVPLEQ